MFEAAQQGIPIIAPIWGGIKDYAGDFVVGVDSEVKRLQEHQVWENVLEAESEWCFPDSNSVRTQMREVYNNLSKYKKQAKKHQNFVKENFTEQKINLSYNSIIDSVLQTVETTGEKNETE